MDPRDTAGELSRNGITKSDILNNNDVEKASRLPKVKKIPIEGFDWSTLGKTRYSVSYIDKKGHQNLLMVPEGMKKWEMMEMLRQMSKKILYVKDQKTGGKIRFGKSIDDCNMEKVWGAALKYGAKILPKVKSIAAKGIKRVRRYGKKWKKYPTGRKVLTAAAMGGEIGFAGEMAGKLRRKKTKVRDY